MAKELENIASVTSVGNLPHKMEEAENAKAEVEAKILERVSLYSICRYLNLTVSFQNALLAETTEEWEQCEKKMKDVRSWIEKTKAALESVQNKKKPLRDQHALREKMLADVQIQKTKISLSLEKLQVRLFVYLCSNVYFPFLQLHFRSGIGGDSKITEAAEVLIEELNQLNQVIKDQSSQLEIAIAQVDRYQMEVQQLRQQIIQVEQQLRSLMTPTHLTHDREQAARDQQVGIAMFLYCSVDHMEMACPLSYLQPIRVFIVSNPVFDNYQKLFNSTRKIKQTKQK